MVEPLAKLANALSRLPGIGPKSAQRLAYHIVEMEEDKVTDLAKAIYRAKQDIHPCENCGALTTGDAPCAICSDPKRKNGIICVVKDARDVAAIERMRDFRGQYHVLGGIISPMDGVGPDQLRIPKLQSRITAEGITEVILATNPDVEGEATAVYIANLLRPMGVKITRIAHGVPVGGDLEYTDEVTLSRALEGRREM